MDRRRTSLIGIASRSRAAISSSSWMSRRRRRSRRSITRRLAASLSSAAGATYTAITLPFSDVHLRRQPAGDRVRDSGGGHGRLARCGRGGQGGQAAAPRWHCTLTDYQCTRVTTRHRGTSRRRAWRGPGGQGRGGPTGGRTAAIRQVRTSPGRQDRRVVQNSNIFIRPAGGGARMLAAQLDGVGGQPVRPPTRSPGRPIRRSSSPIAACPAISAWSPTCSRRRPRPAAAQASTRYYRKPGDVVDHDQPVLFDIARARHNRYDEALFPNPYDITRPVWHQGQPRVHVRVQPARPPGSTA